MNTAIHIAAALALFGLASYLIRTVGTIEAIAVGAAIAVLGLVFLLPLTWFALLNDIAVFRSGKERD